jgi:erythronate-4-phosphate dehydrogenase
MDGSIDFHCADEYPVVVESPPDEIPDPAAAFTDLSGPSKNTTARQHQMLTIAVDKNTPFVEEAFRALGEVRLLETGRFSRHVLRDVDVLVVRSETKVDPQLIDETPVKFVGTVTIGTDHVDIPCLVDRGIAFASAPGSNANSVKEYVVAALLALARRSGHSLKGRVLGVVGVGHIGSRVVRAAEALGMTVLQNDPPLARTTGESRFLPLDELMSADVITLHVPLTTSGPDATHHLFDAERIGQMKAGSILVNTSRGSVTETGALLDALRDGHLAGAVLDVWEKEPAISTELLERVTWGTPHIAGYSLDGKVNAVRMVRKAVCSHFGLQGEWDPSDRLPTPASRTITLPATADRADDAIRYAVERCYAIDEDDRNLRKLSALPPSRRSAHFSGLRTGYRIRREFIAYSVNVPPRHAPLKPTLEALGFTLA